MLGRRVTPLMCLPSASSRAIATRIHEQSGELSRNLGITWVPGIGYRNQMSAVTPRHAGGATRVISSDPKQGASPPDVPAPRRRWLTGDPVPRQIETATKRDCQSHGGGVRHKCALRGGQPVSDPEQSWRPVSAPVPAAVSAREWRRKEA